MVISATTVRTIVSSLIIVAAILCVVATATNYWIDHKGGNIGLWRTCDISGRCYTIDYDSSNTAAHAETKTVKAFMLISCIGYGLVIVYSIIQISKGVFKSINADIAGVLLLTVTCEVIAMSVFTYLYADKVNESYNKRYGYKYGYSYGMGWTAPIFTGIAAGMLICFYPSESS